MAAITSCSPLYMARRHPALHRLVVALLLITVVAIAASYPRLAFAQTPAPGAVLAGGDFINTQNDGLDGVWESFPAGNALGHVLYMWQGDVFVSRGLPCPSTSVSTPCYNWIQYTYNADDPYNTGLWSPFQRGCMLLGANPINAAEADGLSRVTDIYVAGGVFTPISHDVEPVGLLNDAGSGSGSINSASALDSACSGGPVAPPSSSGGASWAGTWSTTYGAMQLNQSGSSVSGTYESNAGRLTGTISGNVLQGTWSESPSYAPPDHAGDFQFTLSADGNSFTGGWRYGSSGTYSDWTGTRTGGTPAPRSAGVSGTWDSNVGVWTFTQSGNSVNATIQYTDGSGATGPVTGTLSGTTISYTYTASNSSGTVHGNGTLTVSANGCTMTGNYHNQTTGSSSNLSLTKRGC